MRAFGAAGGSVGSVIERLRDAARLLDPLFASAITIPPNGFWERREVGRLRSLLPKATTDLFAPLPSEHPFRLMAASPGRPRRGPGRARRGPDLRGARVRMARRGQPTLEGGLAGTAGDVFVAAGDIRRGAARTRDALSRSSSGAAVWRACACGRATRPSAAITCCGRVRRPRWARRWRPCRRAAQAPARRARHRIPLQHRRARRARGAARRHALTHAGDRRSVAPADRGQRRRDHGRPAHRRAIRGGFRSGSSAASPPTWWRRDRATCGRCAGG